MSTANKRDSTGSRPVIRGSDGELVSLSKLGKYEVQKKIGSGGMGSVFLAKDIKLNRLVALKILPPEKAENPTLLKRFEAEAQAAAQLTHDNIVRVYESGEADGLHFISMEYVEGTDVQRLIKKRNRIPVRRSTEIIKQVALALQHAAEASIVHRDIKPSNLLITQSGLVKLTDLGLARIIDDTEETSITRAGTTVGTVDYMSPEQARSSKAADIRSDIYSLGCTWYHMITGSAPYPEGSVTNKLHAHATSAIPDPREINDKVPVAVVGVIQRMMAKAPVDRHQSVEELLEDIQAVKSTKREVKAEDLAALATADIADDIETREDAQDEAGGVIPPRSKRSRRDAQDSDSDIGESKKKSKRKSKAGSSSKSSSAGSNVTTPSGDALPPREKRKLEDVEDRSNTQISLEYLKFALLALALFALVGGIGYTIMQFADSAGSDQNQNEIDLARQAAELQEEREDAANQQGNAADPQNKIVKIDTSDDPNNKQNSSGSTTIRVDSDLSKEQLKKLPVVRIVDSNAKVDNNSAHSLRDALEKNKGQNLVVELATTSPLKWDHPVQVEGRNLILRAAENSNGNVILQSASALSDGLIQGKNSQIILEKLHFGLLGYDLPGKSKLRLFRMTNADLKLRECSFTLEESRAAPVTLCQTIASTSKKAKVSCQKCLIRGRGWAPFEISADRCQFDMEQCLVVAGSHPLVQFNFSQSGSQSRSRANRAVNEFHREATFADTLVVGRGSQIVMENNSSGSALHPTKFRFLRSHFLVPGKTDDRPFLAVNNWSENPLGTGTGGQVSGLQWLSEKSSYSGWEKRTVATTEKTRNRFEVVNNEQWEKFWGNAGLFGKWSTNTIPNVSDQQYSKIQGNQLTSIGLTAVSRPGQQTLEAIAKLPHPQLDRQSWRATYEMNRSRPKPNSSPFNKSTPRVSVNLNDPKIDLADFLNRGTLPNPVIVEAKGYGLRTAGAIRLKDRQIRIEFISEPGRFPLTLRPKLGKAANENSHPWIQISTGRLEIENGVFNLDPMTNTPMPTELINAVGSDVVLTKSYVTAPFTPSKGLNSLVRSRNSETSTAKNHSLVVDQSYLQYGGSLIETDLSSSNLFMANSVLSSQHRAVVLHYSKPSNPAQADPGVFSIAQSTLSSRNGFLHFDIPAPPANQKPLVSGNIESSVFAVPVTVEGQNGRPTIITAEFPLEQLPNRCWWWGDHNGFANEVVQAESQNPLSVIWPEYWGVGHVQDPLFGVQGVLLEKGTLAPKGLKPSSFELFEDSLAATWGKGKKAIGADCGALDLSDSDDRTNPNSTKPKPVKTTVPRI